VHGCGRSRSSSTTYAQSARGFAGNVTDQIFPNRLLFRIDGRSVYTRPFSGIYADAIDVPLEDVERIEVISGPGATLWGANAMNGVINVITRSAERISGGFLDLAYGSLRRLGNVRYGASTADDAWPRCSGSEFHEDGLYRADGGNAGDGWSKGHAGCRFDSAQDDAAQCRSGRRVLEPAAARDHRAARRHGARRASNRQSPRLLTAREPRSASPPRGSRARLESTMGAAEIGSWIWDLRQQRFTADRNLASLYGLQSETESKGHPARQTAMRCERSGAVFHAGTEALDVAVRRRPDAAILDIGMPDMSG
jgi:outer membrane receptor protein involved in Fe transport